MATANRPLAGSWKPSVLGIDSFSPTSITAWFVAAYFMLIIIRPWEMMFPELAAWRLERMFAIFMIGLCLLEGLMATRLAAETQAILLFMFTLFLSSVFAQSPGIAFDELYTYASIMIVHFVLVAVVRTPKDLVFVWWAIILAISLYIGKSEYEFFVHGRHSFKQGVVRMGGIDTSFGNANAFAASTIFLLPLWLFLVLQSATITRHWSSFMRSVFRMTLWFYGPAAVIAVFESKSRTGLVMLGIAAALGIAQLPLRKHRVYAIAVIGIAFTAAAAFLLNVEDAVRIRTIYDSAAGNDIARESAQGRIEGFKVGLKMLIDYPLLGVGLANFTSARVLHYDGLNVQPHNLAGLLIGETGLIGTFAFLLMLLASLASVRRSVRFSRHTAGEATMFFRQAAFACRNVLFLLMVGGLTGHNMVRFHWYLIPAFLVSIGTMQLLYRDEPEGQDISFMTYAAAAEPVHVL